MNTSRIPGWVWALGVAGVAYALYKLSTTVSSAANAATNAISQTIASAWLSLPIFGLPANIQVLGSVQLPTGTLVPLNSLVGQIRQDSNNNVYANISGTIYQLSPSNAAGNYPATAIAAAPAGS